MRNARSDGTVISSFQYSVDDVGNPTGMVLENCDRVTWTYDSLYRLTREQRDGVNAYDITYTYDLSSNRLTKVASGVTTTYCYDEADRLLTENTAGALTTYSWDDAGNNVLVEAVAGLTTMTWDCENRLRTIQIPGGNVVTNTYGADGLRRKREEGSATVKYLWDGQRLLLESDGADATQALYTAGLGAHGPIVSMRRSGASRFLHPDHLGSIWNLTDAPGDITDSYLYDAWGNVLASSGSTTNPLQYVGALGYYTEAALGLDYVCARWLRPSTGAWLSVDPVPGQKRYAYVGARAVARRDPSGLVAPFECATCQLIQIGGSIDPHGRLPYLGAMYERCADVIAGVANWFWISGANVIATRADGRFESIRYYQVTYDPGRCPTAGPGTSGGPGSGGSGGGPGPGPGPRGTRASGPDGGGPTPPWAFPLIGWGPSPPPDPDAGIGDSGTWAPPPPHWWPDRETFPVIWWANCLSSVYGPNSPCWKNATDVCAMGPCSMYDEPMTHLDCLAECARAGALCIRTGKFVAYLPYGPIDMNELN